MPTYEYNCEKCGHHFEKVQRITDAALTVCPKDDCGWKKWGKGRVTRAIGTGGGLIFKGSGFYITDYRSENYKAGARKDSAPAAASGDAAKTPAKTEAKSEAKPAKPAKAKE